MTDKRRFISEEDADAWMRHEVLSNPEDYPNLVELVKKQNAWRFNHGKN